MSAVLHFVMYPLQEAALACLFMVYTVRLLWLHQRFRLAPDRQQRTGRTSTNPLMGAVYSIGIIAMPSHLVSAAEHPVLYLQFVGFHLGAAAAIALSVILPYMPEWLTIPPLVWTLNVTITVGILVGIVRLVRRFALTELRAMSTLDDYFSLGLLVIWLTLALVCLPKPFPVYDGWVVGFFSLTAFFLFYIPFSKISHYIYYPFNRFWFGRTMGHRGVYPLVRVPAAVETNRSRSRNG